MKVVLPEALHARPADLLVRLASRQTAQIELRRGTRTADARKVLDVLALGAARGDELVVEARGEDAEGALRAIVELVESGFSRDVVPEMGFVAVEGIAVGRAVVLAQSEKTPRASRGASDERARASQALSRAEAELAALVAALPPGEAALFEPERAILRDAAARVEAEIAAGVPAEQAVRAVLAASTTDLVVDARDRWLDALAGAQGEVLERIEDSAPGDLVLVTGSLTPSLVARLPARVRGIVGVEEEHAGEGRAFTSHAAILARGRGLPLALVPAHAAASIVDGDEIVLDTTTSPARVWAAPSTQLVVASRARQEEGQRVREGDARASVALDSRLGVELWVNVGSLHERVPPAAQGVGLLRTELIFAGRSTVPSEAEQYAALVSIARGAGGKPVTARLFDGGGDKPLPWLPSPADERGVALLFAHPGVLGAQVRALLRAARTSPIRALLPMCRSAADVRAVRELAPSLPVGAMIETPDAAREAAAIAGEADFICIGTNDLAALVLGERRGDVARALHPRVVAAVEAVVHAAHARGRRVTVCGEVAADPLGARVLVGLGVDSLSVAPTRFAALARALAGATLDDCRAAAQAALREAP